MKLRQLLGEDNMVREDCSKCLYDCNKSLKCKLRKLRSASNRKQILQKSQNSFLQETLSESKKYEYDE